MLDNLTYMQDEVRRITNVLIDREHYNMDSNVTQYTAVPQNTLIPTTDEDELSNYRQHLKSLGLTSDEVEYKMRSDI